MVLIVARSLTDHFLMHFLPHSKDPPDISVHSSTDLSSPTSDSCSIIEILYLCDFHCCDRADLFWVTCGLPLIWDSVDYLLPASFRYYRLSLGFFLYVEILEFSVDTDGGIPWTETISRSNQQKTSLCSEHDWDQFRNSSIGTV
jgi:hypothetical protein